MAAVPVEKKAVSSPMMSDFCSPRMVRAKTSWPSWVVPNQWFVDGPWRALERSWSR